MHEYESASFSTENDSGAQILCRRLGHSGLFVSAVSLSLNCGSGIDGPQPSKQLAIVERALELGVNHFDLTVPPNDVHKKSQLVQKDVLSALYERRDDIVLSSQVGFHPRGRMAGFGSRKHITSALDQILRQTGLEYLDILYINRYDRTTPMRETVEAMTAAFDRGKALYVGLSDYAPASALRVAQALNAAGTPAIAFRAPFSFLNPWAQEALMPIMNDQGSSLVAETSLPQRLISYVTTACRDRAGGETARLRTVQREAMKRLESIAVRRGQSLSSLAISWVLRDWRVSSSLMPISSIALLEEVTTSVNYLNFTADELSAIDSCREQIDAILGAA